MENNPLVTMLEDVVLFIDYVLVPLVFALALIAFLWGIFNYFIAGGADEEKRSTGKTFMIWGFVGFFVMVSVWGIVNLLVGTFGFGGQTRPALPTFGDKIQGSESTDTFGGDAGDDTLGDDLEGLY